MRNLIFIISFFIPVIAFGQMQKLTGTYTSRMPRLQVTFNNDSTFEYRTNEEHPTFYRWEDFYEEGRWTVSGDTVILNPGLQKKIFVESGFTEGENKESEDPLLTFNHIKRWFGANGALISTDTLQIAQLDYSFNALKRKNRRRVTPHRSNRCAFAGYIPKEIITTNRTITVQRPGQNIKSIFIGCYELQGTKEFVIKNQQSNHFTFNVYSNYYQDGQIRQMKFLVKNDRVLYTRQKANGKFEKDNIWTGGTENKLIKQKGVADIVSRGFILPVGRQ
jgi:hypothetical protein